MTRWTSIIEGVGAIRGSEQRCLADSERRRRPPHAHGNSVDSPRSIPPPPPRDVIPIPIVALSSGAGPGIPGIIKYRGSVVRGGMRGSVCFGRIRYRQQAEGRFHLVAVSRIQRIQELQARS